MFYLSLSTEWKVAARREGVKKWLLLRHLACAECGRSSKAISWENLETSLTLFDSGWPYWPLIGVVPGIWQL